MAVQIVMPGSISGKPPLRKRHSASVILLNGGMETIGARVRTERLRLGMTQQSLALAVGRKKETIRDLELGKSRSSTKLHLIAGALGVCVTWLETGKGPRLNEPATETNSETGTTIASQSAGLDRPILHEALTLLFYDELHAGDYTPHARTDRLAELYEWVSADGGRLSKERNAAFVRQVSERNRQAGGDSDSGNGDTRSKVRTGTSRH